MNNNKLMLAILGVLSSTLLTGCFRENRSYDDLDTWMLATKKEQVGKIKPLPAAKEFTPVEFRNPLDPFKEKEVLSLSSNDRFAPDFNRRKEPLESFQLGFLTMTGSVVKDGKLYAMITTPDAKVHYVTIDNYMGVNYGKIVKIDESGIVLEERHKNSVDEWEIKVNRVYLVEPKSK